MQYRCKQLNLRHRNQNMFLLKIKLKQAYFKHRRGKMFFFGTQSSNQLKFSANKPKDVFDKLRDQKRISCRKQSIVRLFLER